jgi:hypothetical protein
MEPLPADFSTRLNPFQQLLVFRCFRPDRVYNGVKRFVMGKMGETYVQPPVLDYHRIYAQSTPTTPVVFILSPGADPQSDIQSLGQVLGFTVRVPARWAVGRGGAVGRGAARQHARECTQLPHSPLHPAWRAAAHQVPFPGAGSGAGGQGGGNAGAGHGARPLGAAVQLPPAAVLDEEPGKDPAVRHQAAPRLPPVAHHRPHRPLPAGHPAAVAEGGHGAAGRAEAEHAGLLLPPLRRAAGGVPPPRLQAPRVHALLPARGGAGAAQVRVRAHP